MKKLALVLVVLLFASVASAQVISNPTTNARMDGLGVKNWQIEDDFNIWINPAQITHYKSAVYGELGSSSLEDVNTGAGAVGSERTVNSNTDPYGGLHLAVPYGTWGLYIGRPYEGPAGIMDDGAGGLIAPAPLIDSVGTAQLGFSDAGDLGYVGTDPGLDITVRAPDQNKIDLFYAPPNLPLGFYISYASKSDEEKSNFAAPGGTPGDGSVKNDQDTTEINFGGGAVLNVGFPLDLALNLGLTSVDNEYTASVAGNGVDCPAGTTCTVNHKLEDDASINIALLARAVLPVGANSKLLTTAILTLTDASSELTTREDLDGDGLTTDDEDAVVKIDDDAVFFSIGTALNSRPNADTLVVTGVRIDYGTKERKANVTDNTETPNPDRFSNKVETTTFSIPLNLAIEHRTFKRVKTRLGLSKPIWESTEIKESFSDPADNVGDTVLQERAKSLLDPDTPTAVSVGLGWMVHDNLTLDAVINQDVLFTGTYLISGVPETLSSKISATYRFQ